MRGKTTLWIVIVLMVVLGFKAVFALDNLMALQGSVEDSGQPASGNLTITIYNQSSGGTLLYSSGTDFNNKIVAGRFDVMLGQVTDLTLEYGKYYFMDMSVNGQDLDFNGSERQIFQASTGMIRKDYIYSTGTWTESEIPSLTGSWSGTIDGSKISGSASLNVNNSQFLGSLSKNDFLNNDTQLDNRIDSVNSSVQSKLDVTDQRFNDSSIVSARAFPGACSSGQVVQNTTTGGVQCIAVGTGSVTQITATGPGLTGGIITSSGSIGLNTTYLDTLYLLLSDQRFNETTRIDNVNTSVQNKLDLTDQRYNETTRIDSVNSSVQSKLNLTDQRYNETTRIDNVNTSVQSKLDLTDQRYNDSSIVSARAFPGACSSGQVVQNTTTGGVQCVAVGSGSVTQVTATGPGLTGGVITNSGSIGLNTTYLDTLYLLLSDQRFNETTRIDNVNTSVQNKLDLTDQRYNETTRIDSVNSSVQSKLNLTDQRYNETTRIDNVNTSVQSKLDLTDQRYNETTSIANVNTTANIQNLGFNTTAQLDSRYYSGSNPSGYITDGNTNWDNIYDLINSTYGNNTYVRVGTSCQCSNIADRMYNFTVNANGVCAAVCGSDVSGSSGSIDLDDLFSRQYYYRTAMFESVTSGYNEPWIGTAISSGTSALIAGTSEHPGTASLVTSTTASSGYSYQISAASTYLLSRDYKTSVVFKPFTKTGNVTVIRFGFMDSFTSTLPVDGVYFNITQYNTTNLRATGHIRNNNAQYNTTTGYNLTNNTWFSAYIYVINSTSVYFAINNETTQLWSDTATGVVPTAAGRETSHAFIAYTVGGTTAQTLAHIDHLNVGINRTLVR